MRVCALKREKYQTPHLLISLLIAFSQLSEVALHIAQLEAILFKLAAKLLGFGLRRRQRCVQVE